ncbi:hypothetical protein ACJX0J_021938 [Zea mays]
MHMSLHLSHQMFSFWDVRLGDWVDLFVIMQSKDLFVSDLMVGSGLCYLYNFLEIIKLGIFWHFHSMQRIVLHINPYCQIILHIIIVNINVTLYKIMKRHYNIYVKFVFIQAVRKYGQLA